MQSTAIETLSSTTVDTTTTPCPMFEFESILTKTDKGLPHMPEIDANLPATIILNIMSYSNILRYAFCWTCKELATTIVKPALTTRTLPDAAFAGNVDVYVGLSKLESPLTTECSNSYSINRARITSCCSADFFAHSLPANELVELCKREKMSYKAILILIMSEREDAGILAAHILEANPSIIADTNNQNEMLSCALLHRNAQVASVLVKSSGWTIRFEYGYFTGRRRNIMNIMPDRVYTVGSQGDVPMLRWYLDNGAVLESDMVVEIARNSPESAEYLRMVGYAC